MHMEHPSLEAVRRVRIGTTAEISAAEFHRGGSSGGWKEGAGFVSKEWKPHTHTHTRAHTHTHTLPEAIVEIRVEKKREGGTIRAEGIGTVLRFPPVSSSGTHIPTTDMQTAA